MNLFKGYHFFSFLSIEFNEHAYTIIISCSSTVALPRAKVNCTISGLLSAKIEVSFANKLTHRLTAIQL